MVAADILDLLKDRWTSETRPKGLFNRYVSREPDRYVPDLIRGLRCGERRVENGCAELASLLSEVRPELLYPHLALFQANLTAKEPVLRWEAVCTIGNLAAVDDEGRVRSSVASIGRFLSDKSIVLQGHAVRALAKVARAHTDLAPSILDSLLSAVAGFPGNRVGYLVEAMETFTCPERLRLKATAFAEPLARSDIKSVATKARKALKRLSCHTG